MGGGFVDILLLSDNNVFTILKTSDIAWDTNSVKVFDLHISKTFFLYLGLEYQDNAILQSMHNYNNVWYGVVKQNEVSINNIWQIIYMNQGVVFKKKYTLYKVLISYIFVQAVVGCFCSIGMSLHEEVGDDLILKASG